MTSLRYVCLVGACCLCLFGTVQGVEFFFDDFEDYVDEFGIPSDAEVELGGWRYVDENNPVEASTWTILNPGGRLPPPGEDGTPSEGAFLISDSDAQSESNPTGSGMSHDLWSPPIEVSGGVVWLHLDCSAGLNNNGKAVFDVDVSNDEGATWTNVFRRVAPARVEAEPRATTANVSGFFGRLHLDVSDAIGAASEFQFRVRHFEPNFDWWIAVDNVLVDDVPPALGGTVNLLGMETFTNGIPDTWEVRGIAAAAGGNTWTTADPCQRSVEGFNDGNFPYQDGHSSGRLGDAFAIMDSDCDPDVEEDEYLITPVIDCSEATEVYLHFKSESVLGAFVQEVLLSVDGGVSFELTPLFSYTLGAGFTGGEDPTYVERIISAPAAAGESEVAFAFHHQGNNNWWWGVDDVRVSASGPGLATRNCANREFQVGEFNAQNVSVTMTWKAIEGDEGFRVLANGTAISGVLPAGTTSYTDSDPPAGGTIEYTLETLQGGGVEFSCTAPPVEVLSCPRDLVCCADSETGTVTLSWTNGANIAGTGWRILRGGIPVRTIALTESSYVDTPPAPGTYEYTLSLNGGDASQCPDLPLSCVATVLGGGVFFADDFDCYATDDDLTAAGWEIREENMPVENAAWTLANIGARGNPARRDGTASNGKFIVSDSDAAGGANPTGSGMSHDIWSPPFSTTGQDTVWLHMSCTAVLNNNGVCVFDIDVTTNDGASWTNVFRRVAPARIGFEPEVLADIPEGFDNGPQVGNADGFYGALDVDISDIAANSASVRFRLRHFEPNDDWWVSVDDVVVDDQPATGGASVVLPTETFEDDIPPDWGIESDLDGLALWRAEDLCLISLLNSAAGLFPDAADGRQVHHMDQTFAHVYGDEFCVPAPQDEYLTTPVLDLSGATSAYLHFKSALILVGGVVPEVLLSLDGGATFDRDNPVFSYATDAGALRDGGNAEMYYNEHVIPVPQAADESQVVFAFRYFNPSGSTAGWAIDDVSVTADGLGGGVTFRRGDADAVGEINLTDGVFLLNFLFLGGPPPPCADAADANDDGQLNITTGVYVFNWLFLGGPLPPAPGPTTCGEDPSGDALDCQSYDNC